MMAKRIRVLLLALAAPLAHADTLPSLRDACRQSALQVEETAAAAFSACDPYHAAARPSAADSVLAGIYMARINDRLTRLDARQLGEGQALGDAQRHYSRPQRYLDESAVAAAGLESGQRWLVPELVALLTSNSGIGVHAAAAVFKQVQASPMAQGLDEGPQWAALELAAASFAELRRGAQGEQQRQQFLAHWPQVMHGLAQIDDGPLRALLELRATRQRAQLQQRDDPAAAFQSLLSAWQQARAIPAELGFMQLLLANALEEHPALARSEMATVWSIVNDSPEAAFKARLVRSLSTVAEECTQIQALDVLAQQYADADGQDEASPVSGLMLRTLYGDLAGMRRELRGLQCLSPQRLRALDDGGLLSNLLQAAARQAGKDGELHRELAQLRTRMKAR